MNHWLDPLRSSICHGGGEHADMLPFCLRCSSVYAGALAGATFEIVLRAAGGRRHRRSAVYLASAGLALMAVLGPGGLYGVFAVPDFLKVLSALYFGWSIGFFAISAVANEMGTDRARKPEPFALRGALLGLFAAYSAALARGAPLALRALGAMASVGAFTAFLTVNFAFALLLTRRCRWRIAVSFPLIAVLLFAEFALFAAWRQGIPAVN